MYAYIAKRLINTLPVVIGVTLLVFMMIHMLPGDPVMMMLGEMEAGTTPAATDTFTEDQYDEMRRHLGLDRPLHEQYLSFLTGVARGDLGTSLVTKREISEMIARNLPSTIELAVSGLALAVALGLTAGSLAASFHGKWIDTFTMGFSVVAVSMPGFWFGLLLIMFVAYNIPYFPISGGAGLPALILPALGLGVRAMGILTRLTRSSLLEVLDQDYIRTARSKGLEERVILYKHAMRNALIPVVTMIGLQLGTLMAGAVVIETVFSRPGIGRMVVRAIWNQDFPVVQGVVLISATLFILVNLVVDLSYAFFDPRIRYG